MSSCPCSTRSRRRSPRTRRGCTSASRRSGLFHGLGELGEGQGNVCYRHMISAGNVEETRARAAITVEGSYTFPAVYQYAMETHATIAHYHGDGVTLWANCQHPFLVQAEIADLFELEIGSVRIIVPYLGGGFGSKSYTKMEPLTVALARKAGRPVRIVNAVDESMVTSRRHGMRCWMRTTAAADGTLLTREVEFSMDTGAYADNGPRVTATAADAAPGPYRFEAVEVDASCVYCNTPPSGSYRAFGATHLQWIGESQLDEIARRAGIDPLELRQRNLVLTGDPVRPDGSGKPLDADLIGDVERAALGVGWDQPRRPWVGRGVSVGLLAAGAHPVSRASVRLCSDGSADVYVGTTEMGQGPRTVMSQIAAEEIGVPSERVRVHGADTRFTPYDRSTGASRSTTIAGLAVKRAATAVADRLRETAGELWEVSPEVIELTDGRATFARTRSRIPDLIAQRFGFRGGEIIEGGEVRPSGGDTGSYAEGPHFWEVCVAARGGRDRPRDWRRDGPAHVDDRRRRQGDQPATGRATGRGRDLAGNRQRAVRGDAVRRRPGRQRQPSRIPDSANRGPAPRDDLDHRRERGRPWALWSQGLRRRSVRRRTRRDRLRARRRGRADERAAADPRAGVAADPGAVEFNPRTRKRTRWMN